MHLIEHQIKNSTSGEFLKLIFKSNLIYDKKFFLIDLLLYAFELREISRFFKTVICSQNNH
jgi:hypothetical protein